MLRAQEDKAEEVLNLQQALAQASEGAEAAKRANVDLEQQLESALQRMKALQTQVSLAYHAKDELTARVAQMQGSHKLNQEELDELRRAQKEDAKGQIIAELRQQMVQMQQDIEGKEQEIVALKAEVTEKGNELLKSQNVQRREIMERGNALTDLQRARQKQSTMAETLEKTRHEADVWKQRVEILERDMKQLQTALAKAETDKEHAVKAAMIEATMRAKTGNGNVSGTLSSSTSASALLGSSAGEEGSDAHRELIREHQVLKAQFESLWEEKVKCEDQLQAVMSGVNSSKAEMEGALKREALHREVTSQLTSQVAELTSKLSSLINEKDALLSQVSEGQALVTQTLSELTEAHTVQQSLMDKNMELKEAVDRLEATNQRLREERAGMVEGAEKHSTVLTQLQEMQDRLKSFNTVNETLEKENSNLRAKIASLTADLATFREEQRVAKGYQAMQQKGQEAHLREKISDEIRQRLREELEAEIKQQLEASLREQIEKQIVEQTRKAVKFDADLQVRGLEQQISTLNSQLLKARHENAELTAVLDQLK